MADIGRSMVSLRIAGRELDPDVLSRRLGHPPTAAARMGDSYTTRRGVIRVVREGYWRLESGEPDAIPLDTKIRDLLDSLTQDIQTWRDLAGQYHIDLFCGLFMDAWNEGLTLTRGVVQLLAERQIPIGFDIYAPVDSDTAIPDE